MPLMSDNIYRDDIDELIKFLQQDPIPRLTNGPKIWEFEKKWCEWLGCKYSIMTNSGASANELTFLALKYLRGDEGEVIVPPLTWISDVSSVYYSGYKPVFCDINVNNLSFNMDKLKALINKNTKAIFITHVLGLNALTDELLDLCEKHNITLIEDCCESYGATFKGKKIGTYGYASNFSFYFAHHMTTIEGGMITTDDYEFYQVCRALRSHGMAREMVDGEMKDKFALDNPHLSKDFIFLMPSHNFRPTEINAVLGLNQIKKLDDNNEKRIENYEYFMSKLDKEKYWTELDTEGQCNYAFIVILRYDYIDKVEKLESLLSEKGIEFRRGLSGGGNQLLQPYVEDYFDIDHSEFPNVNYIHKYSWYIGNHPTLEKEKIDYLLDILNNI